MLTVSLTTIPPRFAGLGPCLESLRAQRGVARVVLAIPHRYRRFPDSFTLPKLPQGVELLRCDDIGPACKVLPLAQRTEPDAPVLYCDDDWAYAQGWAAGFLEAHKATPDCAIAASTFTAQRIGALGAGTVAQGFSGVLLTPAMLPPEVHKLPRPFQPVDDIWLSGMLALAGTRIKSAPHLRALAHPTDNETAPLQAGPSRAIANHACAAYLAKHYGVWNAQTSESA